MTPTVRKRDKRKQQEEEEEKKVFFLFERIRQLKYKRMFVFVVFSYNLPGPTAGNQKVQQGHSSWRGIFVKISNHQLTVVEIEEHLIDSLNISLKYLIFTF